MGIETATFRVLLYAYFNRPTDFSHNIFLASRTVLCGHDRWRTV